MHTKGKVMLQFGAEWCSPCKAMAPQAEDIAKANGFTYLKKDIEAEHELANELNVRGIPTFVLMEDGKELGRQNGGPINNLRKLVEANA